jgi:hypothetical protein
VSAQIIKIITSAHCNKTLCHYCLTPSANESPPVPGAGFKPPILCYESRVILLCHVKNLFCVLGVEYYAGLFVLVKHLQTSLIFVVNVRNTFLSVALIALFGHYFSHK